MYDTRQQLSATTRWLHWSIALSILGQWPLGYVMAKSRNYSLWPIHQSIGYVLLLVVLARVAWRITNGWPVPVSRYSRTEQLLAKLVHWTLLIALLVMVLSGIVSTYAGGYDITVFGFTLIPDVPNHAVLPPGAIHKLRVIPRSQPLHDELQRLHILFAWILAGALSLHVAGALKHHFLDRDGTLRRMLGARVG